MSAQKESKQISGGRGGSRPGAGRPKGRKSAKTLEIEAAAKAYAGDALKALAQIAKRGKSESSRVAAAVALLDRGYGRPRQALEHSGPDGGPIEVAEAEVIRGRLKNRLLGLSSRLTPASTNGHANGNGSNGKNGKHG